MSEASKIILSVFAVLFVTVLAVACRCSRPDDFESHDDPNQDGSNKKGHDIGDMGH